MAAGLTSGGFGRARVPGRTDERVLAHPSVVGDQVTAWMVLGGPALFLLGHALFRRVVWAGWSPWPFAGVALLALTAAVAPFVSALGLAALATAVVIAAAVVQSVVGGGETDDGSADDRHVPEP